MTFWPPRHDFVSDGSIATAGPLPLILTQAASFAYSTLDRTWTLAGDKPTPVLEADFVNDRFMLARDGTAFAAVAASSLWTIANSGPATYVDGGGVIRDALPNTWRRTHDLGSQHNTLGALIEGTRTNYIANSTTDLSLQPLEDPGRLSVSTQLPPLYRGLSSVGQVAKGILDPRGYFYDTTPSPFLPTDTPVTCSASIWLPATLLTNDVYADLDGLSWTVTYSAHADLTRRDQWQRIYVIGTHKVMNDNPDFIIRSGDGHQRFAGTDSIYITTPQCETGSSPSSFIPTSGSTARRPADLVSPAEEDSVSLQGGGTLLLTTMDEFPNRAHRADLTVALASPSQPHHTMAAIRLAGDPVAPHVNATVLAADSATAHLVGARIPRSGRIRVALLLGKQESRLTSGDGMDAAAPVAATPSPAQITITAGGSAVVSRISFVAPTPAWSASLASLADTAGPVDLDVDPAQSTGIVVPRNFVGLSLEASAVQQRIPMNHDTMLRDFLRILGPNGTIRFGGDTSDSLRFQPTRSRIEDAARFMRSMGPGWSAFWGVNYLRNDPAAAATQAATWARGYDATRTYFQIGNEPSFYGHAVSYADYIGQWQTYHDAIAAAVPGARFAGPDIGLRVTPWMSRFIQDKGAECKVITKHLYWSPRFDDPGDRSPFAAMLSDETADYVGRSLAAAAGGIGLKMRMTEAGSSRQPGIGNSLAGALWDEWMMIDLSRDGWAGVNFHEGDNFTPLNATSGYAPYIRSADGKSFTAQGPLYAMVLFNKIVGNRIVPILTHGGVQTSSMAVVEPDGTTRVLLLNRAVDRKTLFQIRLTVASSAAEVLLMTAPSARSTAVTINDAAIAGDGSFHPVPFPALRRDGAWQVLVPASSAALISIK